MSRTGAGDPPPGSGYNPVTGRPAPAPVPPPAPLAEDRATSVCPPSASTPGTVDVPGTVGAGDEFEQRVAITLSVGDGFKFGCGLLLAGIAFYFALLLVVGLALLVAMIIGLPLPFGLGGR